MGSMLDEYKKNIENQMEELRLIKFFLVQRHL